MYQKTVLIGNLGSDPEVKYLQSGTAVVNVGIATEESWRSKDTGERVKKTTWHNVVFWRQLAETAGQYLNKGDRVLVEGKIQVRDYEDREGNPRKAFEIHASEMRMLGTNGNGNGQHSQSQEQAQPQSQPQPAQVVVPDKEDEGDDLPF